MPVIAPEQLQVVIKTEKPAEPPLVLNDALVELRRSAQRLAQMHEADLPRPREARQIERQRIELLQRREELRIAAHEPGLAKRPHQVLPLG